MVGLRDLYAKRPQQVPSLDNAACLIAKSVDMMSFGVGTAFLCWAAPLGSSVIVGPTAFEATFVRHPWDDFTCITSIVNCFGGNYGTHDADACYMGVIVALLRQHGGHQGPQSVFTLLLAESELGLDLCNAQSPSSHEESSCFW